MGKFSQVSQCGTQTCAREGLAQVRWPIPYSGGSATVIMRGAVDPRLDVPQLPLLRAGEVIE